ncbi:hypothetical protein [Caulobacter sp. NIBR2454]|uniref:hypothetical protein n=1 Tax=Caulobacter sp. NIBR2454 TaxID=3015996 RepID=UPI0022B622FC|nr:hypothetical protein [Caulobacter sp. NIBR2454]
MTNETPEAAWERCKPLIAAALEHGYGTHTIDDVLAQIVRGDAVFWPGERSAIVTMFHDNPQGRSLHFWLAGGDMEEIANEMRPCIELWGKSEGCTRATIAGRPGWIRALRDVGYGAPMSVCMKELV